jgi:hypothetical protein
MEIILDERLSTGRNALEGMTARIYDWKYKHR